MSAPATAFALRLDGEWSVLKDRCLQWIAKYQLGGFCVRETCDQQQNVHVHLLLTSPESLKLPALRKGLLLLFPEFRGNSSYSFTTVRDLEKYIRYLCKGTESTLPEIVWQHMHLDAQAQHDAYWAENKQKYRPTLPLSDFVIEKARSEGVEYSNRGKLAEIWVREAVARKKPVNVFQVRSQLNMIQCVLCPTDQQILNLAAEI